jgi:glycyl-tRNA synthetase beta chain
MAELLLELFSEDIPARMQAGAARDLQRLMTQALSEAGLAFEHIEAHAGLRRLVLAVRGLPLAQADRVEERKGPRVTAPEAALSGFLRSTGLAKDDLTERDGVWFASIAHKGRPTANLIADLVPAIIRTFPWPKSMTWGEGSLRWVRPLQRILCVLDGQVVPIVVDGIVSDRVTQGHRFMSDGRAFAVDDFEDYAAKLARAFVILKTEDRREAILNGARALCEARGLELVEDEGLLNEISGMTEWPVPLLGDMDPAFLDLPAEVIRTSMRVHQRYFAVRDPARGRLAPNFVVVVNLESSQPGLVTAGAARVLSARLSDAQFFWAEDRRAPLASRLEKLKGVTFHAKLGTVLQRIERIEAVARALAAALGWDVEAAGRAARLAKADLATGMVGEFPELQGLMGGYYARAEGLPDVLADAIADHYRPQGPSDSLPRNDLGLVVSLADKLDSLVGFFRIGEKPTGSRDPFALRRAALGVIRLILGRGLRLPMRGALAMAGAEPEIVKELEAFFADRLKVMLRDEGVRHDLVDAVLALGDDDITRIVARVKALEDFLAGENGERLLAGRRRAANILEAEARKSPLPEGAPARVGSPAEEGALFDALRSAEPKVATALAKEDFVGAMAALAELREPVDAFFEALLVNSPVADERDNRLRLLQEVRRVIDQTAAFSLLAG